MTNAGSSEIRDVGISEFSDKYGWFARGDKIPDEIRVPFNRPSARHIYQSLPFLRRFFISWLKNIGKKETLPINFFEPLTHKPYYGKCEVRKFEF